MKRGDGLTCFGKSPSKKRPPAQCTNGGEGSPAAPYGATNCGRFRRPKRMTIWNPKGSALMSGVFTYFTRHLRDPPHRRLRVRFARLDYCRRATNRFCFCGSVISKTSIAFLIEHAASTLPIGAAGVARRRKMLQRYSFLAIDLHIIIIIDPADELYVPSKSESPVCTHERVAHVVRALSRCCDHQNVRSCVTVARSQSPMPPTPNTRRTVVAAASGRPPILLAEEDSKRQ